MFPVRHFIVKQQTKRMVETIGAQILWDRYTYILYEEIRIS